MVNKAIAYQPTALESITNSFKNRVYGNSDCYLPLLIVITPQNAAHIDSMVNESKGEGLLQDIEPGNLMQMGEMMINIELDSYIDNLETLGKAVYLAGIELSASPKRTIFIKSKVYLP